MMHCKFNVSSSASLHQSQAISDLVWSAQSNRVLCGPGRLVSSLLSDLPLGEMRISHVGKLLFASQGLHSTEAKAGEPKCFFYSAQHDHHRRRLCCLGSRRCSTRGCESLRSGTCNPSRYVGMFSLSMLIWHYTVAPLREGGLFEFKPVLK